MNILIVSFINIFLKKKSKERVIYYFLCGFIGFYFDDYLGFKIILVLFFYNL